MIVLAEFIGSAASRYVIAAAAFAATGCTVVTLAFVFGKREARLERRLAGYDVRATTPIGQETSDSMHLVQQASEVAGRIAGAGVLEKVEQLLEQAKLPLRPAEFLVYAPIGALVAAVFAYLVFGPVLAVVAMVALFASPFMILKRRSRSRLKKFQSQLPDALNLLAGFDAGRLLVHAGPRGRRRRGERADPRRAAARVHRVPSRPPGRGSARRRGPPHGEPRPRVGRHGDPHPARRSVETSPSCSTRSRRR